MIRAQIGVRPDNDKLSNLLFTAKRIKYTVNPIIFGKISRPAIRKAFGLSQGSGKKNAKERREQKIFHVANLKSQVTEIGNCDGLKTLIFGTGEMNCAR